MIFEIALSYYRYGWKARCQTIVYGRNASYQTLSNRIEQLSHIGPVSRYPLLP